MAPAVSEPWQQRRRQRVLAAVAISAVAVLAGYLNVLSIFRGELQRYLGIDDPRFGLLFGLGPLVGVATVLAGGAWVNRLGAVRLIRLSLIGTAAGMALVAMAGARYGLVLAGCVVSSALAGPLNLATNVYLTKLFPRHRRRILAFTMAIVCGGGIVLPLAAEGLLGLPRQFAGVSFQDVLRWPALAVAAVLLAASFAYRSKRPIKPPRAGAGLSWRQFLLPLPVAWLVVLLAIHSAADTALYTWMSKFLAGASFNAHPVAPGIVLAGFSLAYLVSRSILASMPEARGHRVLMALPGLLGGSVLIAGILCRDFYLTAGGYVLGAFCWSAEFPTFMGMVARAGKQQFGAALAVFQVLTGPLMSAMLYGAGTAAGVLGEQNMWQVMAVMAGGFLVVGAGGAAWLALWGERKGA